MGLTWPWTGPVVPATLFPYLVGIVVQFKYEQIARYWKSPSWVAIPFIFHVGNGLSKDYKAQKVWSLIFIFFPTFLFSTSIFRFGRRICEGLCSCNGLIWYAAEDRCGVVVKEANRSGNIAGTCPLKDNNILLTARALDDSNEVRNTIAVVNELSKEMRQILLSHPANPKCAPGGKNIASVVLLGDSGI
ncbi:hypothetical protein JHK87_006235 [Glycine soja]|nr:hypothetical protein JHK87_006235 [Glycine soja]